MRGKQHRARRDRQVVRQRCRSRQVVRDRHLEFAHPGRGEQGPPRDGGEPAGRQHAVPELPAGIRLRSHQEFPPCFSRASWRRPFRRGRFRRRCVGHGLGLVVVGRCRRGRSGASRGLATSSRQSMPACAPPSLVALRLTRARGVAATDRDGCATDPVAASGSGRGTRCVVGAAWIRCRHRWRASTVPGPRSRRGDRRMRPPPAWTAWARPRDRREPHRTAAGTIKLARAVAAAARAGRRPSRRARQVARLAVSGQSGDPRGRRTAASTRGHHAGRRCCRRLDGRVPAPPAGRGDRPRPSSGRSRGRARRRRPSSRRSGRTRRRRACSRRRWSVWSDLKAPSSCEWHWTLLPALSVQSSPMAVTSVRSVR